MSAEQITDQYKLYWQSLRKELTEKERELADTQRRLAEKEAAYEALCTVHAELVNKTAASSFELNIETGKMYAVFGLSRDRGLAIYNACADVVLGKERLFKVAAYIQKVWDIAGCSNEAERLYANYLYGWMASGHSSTPMNAAQIESFRLEFKEYGHKTSAVEYEDGHDYTDN